MYRGEEDVEPMYVCRAMHVRIGGYVLRHDAYKAILNTDHEWARSDQRLFYCVLFSFAFLLGAVCVVR